MLMKVRCRYCGCELQKYKASDETPSVITQLDWPKHEGMMFNCTVREGWSRNNTLGHEPEPPVVDYVRKQLS